MRCGNRLAICTLLIWIGAAFWLSLATIKTISRLLRGALDHSGQVPYRSSMGRIFPGVKRAPKQVGCVGSVSSPPYSILPRSNPGIYGEPHW
ncbi:hypothetical protein LINPERHAP1_LOCUS31776 [Linum perenne]